MKINILIIGIAVFAVLACGCLQQGNGKTLENASATVNGTLEGSVNIGPICPVEREGVSCEVPPEAYDARKIIVYNGDGNVIKELSIDYNGSYRAFLSPGIYVVDINRIGIDQSSDVPKEIEIKSNQTLRLDIDIDTRIR